MLLRTKHYQYFILVIGYIIFTVWITSEWSFSQKAKILSRKNIINMYNEINLGDSREHIENLLQSIIPANFKIYKRGDSWVVKSPGELGASEWIVVINFDKDQVDSTRIRIADGNFHPKCAPIDKTIFGTAQQYKDSECIVKIKGP